LLDDHVADIAGGGFAADPDFRQPCPALDNVAFLDADRLDEARDEAVARMRPWSGTSQPVTVALRA